MTLYLYHVLQLDFHKNNCFLSKQKHITQNLELRLFPLPCCRPVAMAFTPHGAVRSVTEVRRQDFYFEILPVNNVDFFFYFWVSLRNQATWAGACVNRNKKIKINETKDEQSEVQHLVGRLSPVEKACLFLCKFLYKICQNIFTICICFLNLFFFLMWNLSHLYFGVLKPKLCSFEDVQ